MPLPSWRSWRSRRSRRDDSAPADPPAPPPLLVVGGSGPLADAVRRELGALGEVRRVHATDEFGELLDGVATVVVLEGLRAPPKEKTYRRALGAVARGLAGSSVTAVVTLTYPPAEASARKNWLRAAEAAEAPFPFLGVRFLVLRCELIIGTPRDRAPADRFLFDRRMRGDGTQRCTPIVIDDMLAAGVRGAAPGSTARGTLWLQGPEQVEVRSLLRRFTPEGKLAEVGSFSWSAEHTRYYLPDKTIEPVTPLSDRTPLGTPLHTIDETWSRAAIATLRDHVVAGLSPLRYSPLGATDWTGVLLLAVGAMVAWFGTLDLLLATDLADRARSGVLFVIGALCVAAFVVLRTGWHYRYLLAFFATICAAVTAGSVVVAVLVSPGGSPVLLWLAGLVLVLALISAVRLVLKVPRLLRPVAGIKPIVGSLLSLGALIGLWQFWYTEIYLPQRKPPTLELSAALRQGPGLGHGSRAVAVTLDVANPGGAEAHVLASHFELVGLRTTTAAAREGSAPARPDAQLQGRDDPLGTQARVSEARLLRAGTFADTGETFPAAGNRARRFVVAVPPGYRTVVFRAYVIVAKRALHDLAGVGPTENVGPYIVRSYGVYQSSFWHSLTRGDYLLFTIESTGENALGYRCGGFPQLQAYFVSARFDGELPPRCDADSRRIARYYGVTTERAEAELQLPG